MSQALQETQYHNSCIVILANLVPALQRDKTPKHGG